jgi:cupin 2 domain-containing protein
MSAFFQPSVRFSRMNLKIEGDEAPRELNTGDYLNIPAHCRHRVDWTDPSRTTIWLAIHYGDRK